jgi:hypothetical protein
VCACSWPGHRLVLWPGLPASIAAVSCADSQKQPGVWMLVAMFVSCASEHNSKTGDTPSPVPMNTGWQHAHLPGSRLDMSAGHLAFRWEACLGSVLASICTMAAALMRPAADGSRCACVAR